MAQLAANISECPDIETIWHLDPVPNHRNHTRPELTLSHSDAGPYIHVLCPTGYHVIGPNMITCLKGGIWDDASTPYCSASSLYGIPESTILVISVLAGCGALVILALTVLLSHLICFRPSTVPDGSSTDGLATSMSMETIASTSYYVDDKTYRSISSPQFPTLNGKPLASGGYDASRRESGFTNNGYYEGDREPPVDYEGTWENEQSTYPSRSPVRPAPHVPPDRNNRTVF